MIGKPDTSAFELALKELVFAAESLAGAAQRGEYYGGTVDRLRARETDARSKVMAAAIDLYESGYADGGRDMIDGGGP